MLHARGVFLTALDRFLVYKNMEDIFTAWCECRLNYLHENTVFWLRRGDCVAPFMKPHLMLFFFSPPYIICFFFFLPLLTRATMIQPVHSGGCHSNRAASLSILCTVSPLRLSFPGVRLLGFCVQIEFCFTARKWKAFLTVTDSH